MKTLFICCLFRSVFLTLTPFLSPSFQHYSSRGVTVHMVLQHCWSPVATLPTMHLWLWAFMGADRLRGPWYRPAIALCEVSLVRHWSVSDQHTPLTSSFSSILPISPPFSIVTFFLRTTKYALLMFFFLKKHFFSSAITHYLF